MAKPAAVLHTQSSSATLLPEHSVDLTDVASPAPARQVLLNPSNAKQIAGFETRGVEWIPASERTKANLFNNFLQWFSFNIAVTTAPVGCLAVFFGLGTRSVFFTIVFFNAIACAMVGFLATMGPVTGLRQMIIARFSFGYLGASFVAFLNILTQMAFSVLAVLIGGQTLCAVWTSLPLTGGIVIVSLLSLLFSFFGLQWVHAYSRVAWVGVFCIFCLIWGAAGSEFVYKDNVVEGRDLTNAVLSFGGIVFGTAAGWGPIASDYNMHLPEDTSRLLIFAMTFFGNFIPLVFLEGLGFALTTTFANRPDWSDAFDKSWGDLASEILSRYGSGWQSFFMILLFISAVTINIPTTYSTGLSIQALGSIFQRVPRAVWVVFATVAYTIAAIAGQNSFLTIMQNFLSILSYWTAMFFVVLFEEDLFFRKGKYHSADYDNAAALPVGFAGFCAIIVSGVAAVLGMSQTWFMGPVSNAIGGGDLGFLLVLLFAGVVFPIARVVEKTILNGGDSLPNYAPSVDLSSTLFISQLDARNIGLSKPAKPDGDGSPVFLANLHLTSVKMLRQTVQGLERNLNQKPPFHTVAPGITLTRADGSALAELKMFDQDDTNGYTIQTASGEYKFVEENPRGIKNFHIAQCH
ncbi:hypothetical protein HDU98_002466 [Podochytrium sp. JEL0797]|nr:hypothetical protein HDU98_002466 [Podochytrium sp. JEL0797]